MPVQAHLPAHNKEEAAARAYDRALVRLRGQNAATNYVGQLQAEPWRFRTTGHREASASTHRGERKVLQRHRRVAAAPPRRGGGGQLRLLGGVRRAGAGATSGVGMSRLVKVEMEGGGMCSVHYGNVLEKDKEGRRRRSRRREQQWRKQNEIHTRVCSRGAQPPPLLKQTKKKLAVLFMLLTQTLYAYKYVQMSTTCLQLLKFHTK